jgi:hypothetical protein
LKQITGKGWDYVIEKPRGHMKEGAPEDWSQEEEEG